MIIFKRIRLRLCNILIEKYIINPRHIEFQILTEKIKNLNNQETVELINETATAEPDIPNNLTYHPTVARLRVTQTLCVTRCRTTLSCLRNRYTWNYLSRLVYINTRVGERD